MAATKEAKLIMSLIDGVTKPAAGIARSLGVVNKAVLGFGRGMTGAIGAPVHAATAMSKSFQKNSAEFARTNGLAASAVVALGGRSVYQYEKIANALQAVTGMTDKQRESMTGIMRDLNSQFPFTMKEIAQGALELGRAGLKLEQIKGSLKDTLTLSLAGDLDLGQAADIATNVAQAMRLPTATAEESAASLKRIVDTLTYAANNSNTDVGKMGETFKYVAPMAAAAGMSIEQVAALSMSLANNGIKASEAGVALRSALVRMVKPTKGMGIALAGLNIDLGDFVEQGRQISSQDLIGALSLDGIDISGAKKSLDELLSDKLLQQSPQKLIGALTKRISEYLGTDSVIDKATLADNITSAVTSAGANVDLMGFVKALREKGATLGDIANIFDARQGSRLASLLAMDVDAALAEVQAHAEGEGARVAKTMQKGIVGAVAQLVAGMENLANVAANTGALDDIANGFTRISKALGEFSKGNETILKFGTYALLATAAAAPLGFALGGLATTAALVVNPVAWLVAGLGALAAINIGPITDAIGTFARSAASAFSPTVIAGARDTLEAVRSFFSFKIEGDQLKAFDQLARNLGQGFAGAVNAAGAALPDLERIAGSIVDFGSGAWTATIPKIASGMDALKRALSDLVMPKVDGMKTLANSIIEFAERAIPILKPAAFAGLDVIAASFNALASGAGAVARVLGGVTTAFVNFNRGLYSAIDPAALASINSGLTTVFSGITTALGPLKSAFDSIDFDIGGFATNAGAKVGQGVSAIINAFAGIAGYVPPMESIKSAIGTLVGLFDRLDPTPAIQGMMGAFDSLAGYAPDFGSIIGAVRGMADAIAAAVRAIVGAVGEAKSAISSLSSMSPVGAFGSTAAGVGSANANPLKPIMPGDVKPAGRRKSGGPMRAALPYQLHDNELITMGRNSYVTPAHRLQNGDQSTTVAGGASSTTNTFHNTFTVNGANDPKSAAKEIGRILSGQLNRSKQISLEDRAVI